MSGLFNRLVTELTAIWGDLWVITFVLVVTQGIVVTCSTLIILWKRTHTPKPLSERLPGYFRVWLASFIHNIWDRIFGRFWRKVLSTESFKPHTLTNSVSADAVVKSSFVEPTLNSSGKYDFTIPVIRKLLSPGIAYGMLAMVTAANTVLFVVDDILKIQGLPDGQLILLNFLSVTLALFQHVSFWQLDSDLLYYFRKLDLQWREPGLTHKIYLQEALSRVENSARYVSQLCQIEGHNRIQDIAGDKDSVLYRESDVRDLMAVQQTVTECFFGLDKDPGCYERIIEDLYLLIGKRTVAPLAESVCALQKPNSGRDEWFPTDYATLVLQSALKLARDTKDSIPCATSTANFKKFYEYYQDSSNDHPNVKARRIFIISPDFDWEAEMLTELNYVCDKGEDAKKLLPRRDGDSTHLTYLEWIQSFHNTINWEVKFIAHADVEKIRRKHMGKDLPKYMDFLLVPAKNQWVVRFACDLSEKKTLSDFVLEVECCPLKIDYTDSHDSLLFFDDIWESKNVAKFANVWLSENVTNSALRNHQLFTSLVDRIMTL